MLRLLHDCQNGGRWSVGGPVFCQVRNLLPVGEIGPSVAAPRVNHCAIAIFVKPSAAGLAQDEIGTLVALYS